MGRGLLLKLVVGVASLTLLAGCDNGPKQEVLSGPTMGTSYNIKYLVEGDVATPSELQQEIDELLVQLNAQMSTYKKDSELSLFNRSRSSKPFAVSAETALVVNEAIRLNKLTDGALDVTVGPLVNLWGFGPEARPDKRPTDAELAERREIVGIDYLDVQSSYLVKKIPELYVDLSTIAKGWGVDVVANYLESEGIHNYMVEIGGELRLKGVNAELNPWRIAIEKPSTSGDRQAQLIVQPGDTAMATSGDYRNYFEEDGVRYSHIIDPKTGKPINNKVVSVTVLHSSAMTADGLATGFMVMGDVDGIKVADQEGIAVLMVVKTEDGYKQVYTDAFAPYLPKS
jgi:thiamine biosynthesis lipoprotein